MYKEIEGNLITLALEGEFDVIAHGCNCFCAMGAGLAPQMAKAFGADNFKMEGEDYRGDINKLGTIDYQTGIVKNMDGKFEWAKSNNIFDGMLAVVNCYSQYGFSANHEGGHVAPLDYEALTLCLRRINKTFSGKHIGLPLIGCHLAGGVWDYKQLPIGTEEEAQLKRLFVIGARKDVKTIIQEELKEMDITIVHFKP